MKWRRGHQSAHVDDRRGKVTRRRAAVAGGGGIVTVILVLLFGTDILGGAVTPGSRAALSRDNGEAFSPANDKDKELVEFVSFVLDDAQATWTDVFERMGRTYKPAILVLFDGQVESACGFASAAAGPFYCPADHQVYIDLSFFRELGRRLGAPGDFAQAYVLAHELGHHVQTLLGVSRSVQAQKQRDPSAANELSIRQELQADCLAGVWAHGTKQRNLLERGDIEEGMGAAKAVGDDTLQRNATGRVHPESWTHGSSAQRASWFRKGLSTGHVEACDTFSARRL